MLEAPAPESVMQADNPSIRPRPRVRHVLRLGCLGTLLTVCGGMGALVFALQSGPVTMRVLGGNTLQVGSDSFVLSNYSFQNGTTYFLDLNGNGVRNIVQLHYLSDSRSIELVLHYADKTSEGEHQLATVHLP